MNITIGFSKPKNHIFPIFSYLIRLIENVPYSHVYLQWDSEFANSHITYHAAGHSVHFLGMNLFNETVQPLHTFEIDITKEQYKDLLHYCFENSGTDYGIKQIFGIGIVKILGLISINISNPFQDGNKSQVCSELVGHVLNEIFLEDTELDLDTAGPRDIYRFLIELVKEGKVKQIS